MKSEWIDIQKQQPEEFQKVLGFADDGTMIAGNYTKYGLASHGYACNITHWMPLPDPPMTD